MSDQHFHTAPGWPQSRAEVIATSDKRLFDFMGRCDVEPADFEGCLACYAYQIAQEREALAKPTRPEPRVVVEETFSKLRRLLPDSPTVRGHLIGAEGTILAALPPPSRKAAEHSNNTKATR